MAKGILYVESRPGSPEQAAEYHQWYNQTHMPELVAVEGVVSARRFAPLGTDGPFVAIYEIEADDIEAVRARISEAGKSGKMSPPVGTAMDPPPSVTFLQEIHTYAP
jgi:hypothetical protein